MKKVKAVLIDDHEEIRTTIKSILESVEEVEVIGEASSVSQGEHLIKTLQPSLVLLDIEMKDGTGFDLLELTRGFSFHVIFITSHDEFALKAFRYAAIDYILKPVSSIELKEALSKALKTHDAQLQINALLENQSVPDHQSKIVLTDLNTTYLISTRDIVRCEGQSNYTTFYLSDGRKIMVSKPLKYYEKTLPEKLFFRTHQSHMINFHYFDRYDRSEGGIIYLSNGDAVPLAIRRKEAIYAFIKQFEK